MRRLDVLHVPDVLYNNVNLPVFNQPEERIDVRHERRLVPRDVVEDRLPVREDLGVLEQQFSHVDEAVAGWLGAGERLLVLAVCDEDTLFLAAAAGRQDVVGLLPAGGAQGVEDDVDAPELLHRLRPVLVRVDERRGPVLSEELVVPLRRGAVDDGAPELTQLHRREADGAAGAVDEDALALCHIAPFNHAVCRRPVEDNGRRCFGADAVRHSDEVLLRQVHQLRLRVVHRQTGDQIAGPDMISVRLRPSGKTVAGCEWGFPLHGVLATAHVDVGAREAGVDRSDLDLAGLGRADS